MTNRARRGPENCCGKSCLQLSHLSHPQPGPRHCPVVAHKAAGKGAGEPRPRSRADPPAQTAQPPREVSLMSVAEPHRKTFQQQLFFPKAPEVGCQSHQALSEVLLRAALTGRPPGDPPGEFRVGRTACFLNLAPPTVAQECWHDREANHKTLPFEFFFFFFPNTVSLASPQDSEMGLVM